MPQSVIVHPEFDTLSNRRQLTTLAMFIYVESDMLEHYMSLMMEMQNLSECSRWQLLECGWPTKNEPSPANKWTKGLNGECNVTIRFFGNRD